MLRKWKRSDVQPKIAFARELRKQWTRGEQLLWYELKDRRFHGLKFRRQVPIGPYIVDFLCVGKKLIIEVDGDTHYEPGARERDARREDYLRDQGFTIFRCGNNQAISNIGSIIESLESSLGYPID